MAGPFDDLIPSQPTQAPSAPGIIRGRADPYKQAEEQRKRDDAARAEQDQDLQFEKFNESKGDTDFNQKRALRKDFDGLSEVGNYKKIISSYATSLRSDETPEGDQLLINSYAQMLNPTSTVMLGEYQATEQNQTAIDQIRARIQRELKFDSAGRLLPESRARVREEMQNIAERANEAYNLRREEFRGLAKSYGFNPEEVIGSHLGTPFKGQIEEYRRGIYEDKARRPEMAGDVPVGTTVQTGFQDGGNNGPFDRDAFLATRGLDRNKEATVVAFWNENRGNEALTPAAVLRFYAENGVPPPSDADLEKMIGQVKAGYRFGGIDTSAEEAAYRAELDKAASQQSEPGYTDRASQGLLMGFSDEVAGIGGAIGSLLKGEPVDTGYQFSRDVERYRQEQADKNTGLSGDIVEIGSSLLLPFGAARIPAQAAKTGVAAGALGGFGYGEGAQGSLTGAGIGALAGGAIGYGASKVGNALAGRAEMKALDTGKRNELLLAAGNLGMDAPPRVITENALQNRARAVAGTIAGGDSLRSGVQKFGDDLQGAVQALSPGKAFADNDAAGGVVKNAAERFIETSGKSAGRQYDAAVKLAGNAKVAPQESVRVLDNAIADLSETAGLNSAEISFLKSLRDDFSKDLSVGALRRARTTLRQKISKGELTFGESEARVLSVMDAAAQDIESGLRSQGNAKAAAAFKAADKNYAERMDYINNTLQRVIGKRNANLSNEQIYNKFRSLSKNDSAALKKFYTTLTPDEAADVSATFAEALGRGGKDGTRDFSTAVLVENIEQLRKAGTSIETIFGPNGAKAIKDIEALAREHKRVSNAIAGQGSAQGNDWRWMLASMFFPTAGTAAAGGDAAVAAGLGAAGFAIKAGRDALSARLLLSSKMTNWFRTAPKTTSPKAIDAHFKRLGAIAKAEPALAAEIDAFRNAILTAANDNAQRAVAEDRQN